MVLPHKQICLLSPLGIFEVNTAQLSLSICPRHRDTFGLRWRCFKKYCTCPPIWVEHKTKNGKGDQGITRQQSKQLLRYANTCSSCLTYVKDLFQAFFTLCGCLSFFKFSILAICKPCRLRLTKYSTRTDTRSSGSPEPHDLRSALA